MAFPGNVHFARVPEFPTERDCGGWQQDTVADQSSHHIGPGPKFGCCVVQWLSSPIAAGCLSDGVTYPIRSSGCMGSISL